MARNYRRWYALERFTGGRKDSAEQLPGDWSWRFRSEDPEAQIDLAQTSLEAPSPTDLFAKADRMTAEKLTACR